MMIINILVHESFDENANVCDRIGDVPECDPYEIKMPLLSFELQAFRKWAQKIVIRTHSDKNPDADAQELLFKR